jgi:P27 family predicted phage terminase small subunit
MRTKELVKMMGRPPKNTKLLDSNGTTKEENAARGLVEDLFGAELTKDLKPSNRLNANQKKIFNHIIEHYKHIGVLGDVDAHMLETTAIAIDRLQNIEKLINQDFERGLDRELMAMKSKYTADFMKGVEMFGMSPSSRAKFGVMAAQAKKEEADPLLKVLKNKSS